MKCEYKHKTTAKRPSNRGSLVPNTNSKTAKKLFETYVECDPKRLTEVLTVDVTWVFYSIAYSKYKIQSWVKGELDKKRPMLK